MFEINYPLPPGAKQTMPNNFQTNKQRIADQIQVVHRLRAELDKQTKLLEQIQKSNLLNYKADVVRHYMAIWNAKPDDCILLEPDIDLFDAISVIAGQDVDGKRPNILIKFTNTGSITIDYYSYVTKSFHMLDTPKAYR